LEQEEAQLSEYSSLDSWQRNTICNCRLHDKFIDFKQAFDGMWHQGTVVIESRSLSMHGSYEQLSLQMQSVSDEKITGIVSVQYMIE